jgi:hypothetical protein
MLGRTSSVRESLLRALTLRLAKFRRVDPVLMAAQAIGHPHAGRPRDRSLLR